MKQILLATNNPKKKKEFTQLLQPLGFQLVTPSDLGIHSQPEETGNTFEENSWIKAKELYLKTNTTTISDDSGIVVDALGGRPGVHSAYYGTPDLDDKGRAMHLLKEMDGVSDRRARYICVICLLKGDANHPIYFEGRAEGEISTDYDETGIYGFGYDPVFYSLDLQKRFSQAPPEEKNSVSHRGRALSKCFQYLEKT